MLWLPQALGLPDRNIIPLELVKITRDRIAIALIAIGLLQMLGHVLHLPLLRGIGLASGISPFPRVFCEVRGYEAFAATYFIEWDAADGSRASERLTPEWYACLGGPYNRRNVYGAAIAFAPRMEPALRDAVLAAAMAPGSSLRHELGIPAEARNPAVRIVPREGETEGQWTYRIPAP